MVRRTRPAFDLGLDGGRACALRRTERRHDFDARRALELGQQLLVGESEAARHHHVDLCARIEETGSFIVGNTPEEFAAEIRTEYEVYKKVVQERKLQPE